MGFREENTDTPNQIQQTLPDDQPTISLNYLYEFSDGDPIFIKDMVATFINESPKTLEELQLALQDKQWETVYKTAHKLKPNFMMLGMKAQQETAATIEKIVKSKDYSNALLPDLINQLMAAAEKAYPILREKLQTI